MVGARGTWGKSALAALAFALLAPLAAPALAQTAAPTGADPLVPPGVLTDLPNAATGGQASISSDRLTYNADTHQIIAEGHVEVDYSGETVTGDRLVFDQRSKVAHFIGAVTVKGPGGIVYRASDLVLSDATSQALIQQLVITTPEGALVTAGSGSFQKNGDSVLTNGTYSPCGQCIDSKGRRIGWSATSSRMIYHGQSQTVTLDQPTLYLLGVPVAWLPWLSMPDPTKRLNRFNAPAIDYSPAFGAMLSVPYFIAAGRDDDILLTPSLLSRQGVMLGAEWDHRFFNGAMSVKASGIDQLDPGAYAGTVGDRGWRGAFQTAGSFKPASEWTIGWSYTNFTDAAYLIDYHFRGYTDTGLVNQVYATKLSRDQFIDFRLQQFDLLGNVTPEQQQQQAGALPNARFRNVWWLGDNGQLDVSSTLLGVQRVADADPVTVGGVTYRYGYEEEKAHGTGEVDWQKQIITPGGVVATPYLGLRLDAAYEDGSSPNLPGAESLFTATPIAAMDVRFPLLMRQGTTSAIFEPIAQIYYRGSDTTDVGITNDNAQSFVFDDTNLFSYNRFAGTDRQETGLRANVGGHLEVNYPNGSWLDVIGGQSFQLAGPNAFAAADPTQVTTGQGLSDPASYMVFGAQGSPGGGVTLASKLQINPNGGPGLARAGVGASFTAGRYLVALDYLYLAKDLDRGVASDQEELGGNVGLPVSDYWSVTSDLSWDLAHNSWLAAGGGLNYDDGYLRYGADLELTGPTNIDPSDTRVTASFWLKGLSGTP